LASLIPNNSAGFTPVISKFLVPVFNYFLGIWFRVSRITLLLVKL
jgi:hypothetical protein